MEYNELDLTSLNQIKLIQTEVFRIVTAKMSEMGIEFQLLCAYLTYKTIFTSRPQALLSINGIKLLVPLASKVDRK